MTELEKFYNEEINKFGDLQPFSSLTPEEKEMFSNSSSFATYRLDKSFKKVGTSIKDAMKNIISSISINK